MPRSFNHEFDEIVITCEHASADVPKIWRHLFHNKRSVLKTHRAYDIGAEKTARAIAKILKCPLLLTRTTRLLIDHNRSLDHPSAFSEFTRGLAAEEKKKIIDRLYQPHRRQVIKTIRKKLRLKKRILHIAIHSFTPRLNGKTRRADIGLLYDHRRLIESRFCKKWQLRLAASSRFRIRRNYPYWGSTDGLTSTLRREFATPNYCGIEVEINQKLFARKNLARKLAQLLASTIHGS